MGLVRMAARTAVVAGTATAVSGRVARRQDAKYDGAGRAAVPSRPPRAAAPGGGRRDRAAPEPGEPSRSGRAHRRGVRGQQGQDPRNLTGSPGGPVRHVEAYSRLAGVYDEIVVDPCHGQWASFLDELWSADPEGVRAVLDLCCGTGLLAGELIARGYRVVGVDASEAMLALARERLGPEVVLSRMTLPELTVDARLRRGGLHARRLQLPHPGRVAADDGQRWPVASGPQVGSSSTSTPTR